jgi:hypothetical protein
MPRGLAVLAVGLIAVIAGDAAALGTYPTNRCVGTKQREAGKYCRAVLEAWGKWETSQDNASRDAALAAAAARLGVQWSRAETKSALAGSNCQETTLAPGDAQAAVDAAVADVVAAVNAGLDLGNTRHATCGGRLLKAAGLKCARLLKAESRYIQRLSRDPDGVRRGASLQTASAAFSQAWDTIVDANCPTAATESAVETLIDDLNAAMVRDTTISPNIDDTQFTTLSPGGVTRYLGKPYEPICMNGSPYHFFVKRGSINKLLMYYQGGGACWEQLTCSLPACDTNVNPAGSDNPNNQTTGLSDQDNPNNPFKDWHVVFVSYCSCDVHFGDAAQDYPLHVEHRGFDNARVAEKWAREHFLNPEVVFVTGSSAGAYGATFHAPLLHEVWPASQFHMLADAGNGVITQEFLETYFPNWHFVENIPPQFPEILQVIEDGTGIPGYIQVVANFFPETNWAHYTTAFDGGIGGQTSFYAIMLNDNDPVAALSWWTASCAFNDVMRAQAIATAAAVPSNYRYYIGTGSRHTMFGTNRVYSDTTGGVPTVVDWINAMLGSTPAWTNVECTNCGLLLPNDPRPNPLQPPFEQQGSDVVINCTPP